MEIYFLLYRRKIDAPVLAHGFFVIRVRDAVFLHHFTSFLDDALNTGAPDKHVMTFFRQHETCCSCERIPTGVGEQVAGLDDAGAAG